MTITNRSDESMLCCTEVSLFIASLCILKGRLLGVLEDIKHCSKLAPNKWIARACGYLVDIISMVEIVERLDTKLPTRTR